MCLYTELVGGPDYVRKSPTILVEAWALSSIPCSPENSLGKTQGLLCFTNPWGEKLTQALTYLTGVPILLHFRPL